ncbi:MAG: undecaprenyl/decaprenyl-phosphate alpha-N-acetylglucosaminyl 1-phosphate transferase [Planctomycetes bacterium]|nr:undecaprenyl/decaprenyl-phosphate alpha-N-acetylglucosaminyl 1-phosphate transferase [Planctomycetota bacterium]MCC7169772.1 undecaprenyl/decaprenyl-phosphate alpha-N-acetylglucosaminyl 1-phosphate transferase [Planctomycetota bacterium]
MNAGQELGLLGAGVAFVAALVLVPIARRAALALDVVDKPGGRKTQRAPVPLLGGVAVALAAVVGVLVTRALQGGSAAVAFTGFERVLAVTAIVFLVGLVDDVFKDRIGPLPKFLAQFLAVVILFHESFARAVMFDARAGDVFYLVAITLWFLTVVNAVNFVDNMNGLCAGLATASLLVGLFGLGSAEARTALCAGALGGALLGFLPFNFPKARIYLGDAGSHLAGFALAYLSITFTEGFLSGTEASLGLHGFVPATLLLGLPLYDLLFSVVRRWRERRPLFHGDNRHLSHRLVGAGLDPVAAVLLLWGTHLMLAAAAVVTLPLNATGRYVWLFVILIALSVLAAWLVRADARRRGTISPSV